MKIRNIIILFLFAGIGSYSSFVFAENINKIVAIVNGDVITDEEVNIFMKMSDFSEDKPVDGKNLKELKKALIERMTEDRLILQEAKRQELTANELMIEDRIEDIKTKAGGQAELEEALKVEGVSFSELREKLRNQLLIYAVIQKDIKSKVNVSPKEVTEYFKEHEGQYVSAETVVVDSIFIDKQEDLTALEAELSERKDFNDVAKKYSKRSSLGEVKRGQYKKGLEDFIFSLKIGKYSKPFEVEGGFYIFLVREKIAASQKTLEEVKDRIASEIESIKTEKLLKEWIENLKEKAYISIRE